MRSFTRAAGVLLPALLLGALGTGLAVTPASATVTPKTCSGYGCHGYDLYHWGCSFTSTTSASAAGLATVDNRYSAGCDGNWAEAFESSAAVAAHDKIVVQISTTDSRGQNELMVFPGPSNTGALVEGWNGQYYSDTASAYTDMVDGTNVTYATVYVYSAAGSLLASATASQ